MIEIQHVSKAFGRVVALDDVSLHIAPGERVAIVGTNGSGKTTLLRALFGLLRFQGRITIGGVEVAKQPELALKRAVYMPQIAPPLETQVSEIVRAHCTLRCIDPKRLFRHAEHLGVDLGTCLRARLRDLSGGTKQKLLAALALATDAEVLVCDEPTANLDAAARSAFFAEVATRRKDGIFVLCSHRAEEVRKLVDRVIELVDGKLHKDTAVADPLDKLQGFRINITLSDPSGGVESQLKSIGFANLGAGHFSTVVCQAEKSQTLARVVGACPDIIADLTVRSLEEHRLDSAHENAATLVSTSHADLVRSG